MGQRAPRNSYVGKASDVTPAPYNATISNDKFLASILHSPLNGLKCPVCGKRGWSMPESLLAHAKNKHKIFKKAFTCNVCRLAGFSRERALRAHKLRGCPGPHWEKLWTQLKAKTSSDQNETTDGVSRSNGLSLPPSESNQDRSSEKENQTLQLLNTRSVSTTNGMLRKSLKNNTLNGASYTLAVHDGKKTKNTRRSGTLTNDLLANMVMDNPVLEPKTTISKEEKYLFNRSSELINLAPEKSNCSKKRKRHSCDVATSPPVSAPPSKVVRLDTLHIQTQAQNTSTTGPPGSILNGLSQPSPSPPARRSLLDWESFISVPKKSRRLSLQPPYPKGSRTSVAPSGVVSAHALGSVVVPDSAKPTVPTVNGNTTKESKQESSPTIPTTCHTNSPSPLDSEAQYVQRKSSTELSSGRSGPMVLEKHASSKTDADTKLLFSETEVLPTEANQLNVKPTSLHASSSGMSQSTVGSVHASVTLAADDAPDDFSDLDNRTDFEDTLYFINSSDNLSFTTVSEPSNSSIAPTCHTKQSAAEVLRSVAAGSSTPSSSTSSSDSREPRRKRSTAYPNSTPTSETLPIVIDKSVPLSSSAGTTLDANITVGASISICGGISSGFIATDSPPNSDIKMVSIPSRSLIDNAKLERSLKNEESKCFSAEKIAKISTPYEDSSMQFKPSLVFRALLDSLLPTSAAITGDHNKAMDYTKTSSFNAEDTSPAVLATEGSVRETATRATGISDLVTQDVVPTPDKAKSRPVRFSTRRRSKVINAATAMSETKDEHKQSTDACEVCDATSGNPSTAEVLRTLSGIVNAPFNETLPGALDTGRSMSESSTKATGISDLVTQDGVPTPDKAESRPVRFSTRRCSKITKTATPTKNEPESMKEATNEHGQFADASDVVRVISENSFSTEVLRTPVGTFTAPLSEISPGASSTERRLSAARTAAISVGTQDGFSITNKAELRPVRFSTRRCSKVTKTITPVKNVSEAMKEANDECRQSADARSVCDAMSETPSSTEVLRTSRGTVNAPLSETLPGVLTAQRRMSETTTKTAGISDLATQHAVSTPEKAELRPLRSSTRRCSKVTMSDTPMNNVSEPIREAENERRHSLDSRSVISVRSETPSAAELLRTPSDIVNAPSSQILPGTLDTDGSVSETASKTTGISDLVKQDCFSTPEKAESRPVRFSTRRCSTVAKLVTPVKNVSAEIRETKKENRQFAEARGVSDVASEIPISAEVLRTRNGTVNTSLNEVSHSSFAAGTISSETFSGFTNQLKNTVVHDVQSPFPAEVSERRSLRPRRSLVELDGPLKSVTDVTSSKEKAKSSEFSPILSGILLNDVKPSTSRDRKRANNSLSSSSVHESQSIKREITTTDTPTVVSHDLPNAQTSSTLHTCPYCAHEVPTKMGLFRHMQWCKFRPESDSMTKSSEQPFPPFSSPSSASGLRRSSSTILTQSTSLSSPPGAVTINSSNELDPISCPDCHRTFAKLIHLKSHSGHCKQPARKTEPSIGTSNTVPNSTISTLPNRTPADVVRELLAQSNSMKRRRSFSCPYCFRRFKKHTHMLSHLPRCQHSPFLDQIDLAQGITTPSPITDSKLIPRPDETSTEVTQNPEPQMPLKPSASTVLAMRSEDAAVAQSPLCSSAPAPTASSEVRESSPVHPQSITISSSPSASSPSSPQIASNEIVRRSLKVLPNIQSTMKSGAYFRRYPCPYCSRRFWRPQLVEAHFSRCSECPVNKKKRSLGRPPQQSLTATTSFSSLTPRVSHRRSYSCISDASQSSLRLRFKLFRRASNNPPSSVVSSRSSDDAGRTSLHTSRDRKSIAPGRSASSRTSSVDDTRSTISDATTLPASNHPSEKYLRSTGRNEPSLICSWCQKSNFASSKLWLAHRSSCSARPKLVARRGRPPLTNDVTGADLLESSTRGKLSLSIRLWACNQCGHKFRSQAVLRAHMATSCSRSRRSSERDTTVPRVTGLLCPGCPASAPSFTSVGDVLKHLLSLKPGVGHMNVGTGSTLSSNSWPSFLAVPNLGFGCHICGLLLASESRLDKHKRAVHEAWLQQEQEQAISPRKK